MNNKISCEMIQDILPLYVDGLTQEKTGQEVKAHLDNCPECKGRYENMIGKFQDEPEQNSEDRLEIDYLKKVKKTNNKNIWVTIFSAVFVIIIGILIKVYFIGTPTTEYSIDAFTKNGNSINVSGKLDENAGNYCRYKVDKTGKVLIYTSPKLPWRKNKFSFELSIKGESEKWVFADKVVCADGAVYSKELVAIFEARNPYVGDHSADGKLAKVIGIGDLIGTYQIELQTTKEPFGWTFKADKPLKIDGEDSEGMKSVERALTRNACLLIAMTDNLGEVTFDFPDGYSFTYTEKDCNSYISGDVKSYSGSLESLQKLFNILELNG